MSRPVIRNLLSLAVCLGLAACAADMATLQRRLAPHARTQRPEGPGPFAAILLVPGCGGIAPGRIRTAEELRGHGYVVTFVDYLSARGLQTACRGEVSPDDVALDIRAASGHLRSLPYVRPEAIGVVGWSLGGAGVLASLSQSGTGVQPPFSVAAAFYPPCSGLQPWKTHVPALLLLAGLDDIAPPAACDALARSVGVGVPIEVRTYPEARHSFDMSGLPGMMPSRAFPGRTTGYNAEAARQAWSEILARFNRHLEPSR